MVDRISLTAAEVAFLMSSRATVRPPLAAALGLTDADFTDAVHSAGLGSLLLRQLATPMQANHVDLTPPLAAVVEGLTNPVALVRINLVAKEGADGSILVDASPVRFLIAPRLFRCFDISGVDLNIDVREPLLQIADAFLRQYQPGVATFTVSTPAGDVGAVSIAVAEDGSWQFLAGPDEATPVVGPDEARERLRDALGQLMSVEV